jgi:hypothetical protein
MARDDHGVNSVDEPTLIGAALPAVTITLMLRRGLPLRPRLAAALGALAAAGVGNIGICFFHPHNSSLAVLVWHCGTVFVFAAAAAIAGGRLLRRPNALIALTLP